MGKARVPVADSAPTFFENDDDGLPQLYFNSNRPGGMGSNDIYMTEMIPDGGFRPAVVVPELNSPENDVGPEIFETDWRCSSNLTGQAA